MDEWIKTGNKDILRCGPTWIGMCIGIGTNAYSACTEAEATMRLKDGTFVRAVDRPTQMRLYQKLVNPQCFRPGRTRPVSCTVGQIFWEVIPGDSVDWFERGRRRRVGVVVGPGEDGEYWEPINARVRVVREEPLATERDMQLTELTRIYRAKTHALMETLAHLTRDERDAFIARCEAEMQAGTFSEQLTSGIDFGMPTKENVRRHFLQLEREAFNNWQFNLRVARKRAEELYARESIGYSGGCDGERD